jgi:hypothetical protein
MSSTIHSLGPKPESGLSCGCVDWLVTTAVPFRVRGAVAARDSTCVLKATPRGTEGDA